MGLLDAFKQYVKDAMPGGLLNAEWTPQNVRNAGEAMSMIPNPVGDVASGLLAVDDVRKGNYGEAALNGIGLLPFIPAIGGMIKGPLGRIPETAADSNKLAKMLVSAAEKKGYSVSFDASGISPSRYVTLSKDGENSEDIVRQIRLSNHADKYPELAIGVRTSVDPDTGVSFEQAVNWLEREGFPTALSTRYKNIPTWEQYYASQGAKSPPIEAEKLLERLRWSWNNNPNHELYKGKGVPEPTMDDALAWIDRFKK